MEVLRRFAQRMEDIVLKAKAIPEVGFLSCLNHLQSRMDFFVGFLCNENLLWVLYSGICYKFMLSLILALFDLIQTNDTVQIFGFKGRIQPADVVQHGIMNSRGSIGQKLVPVVGLKAAYAAQKPQ